MAVFLPKVRRTQTGFYPEVGKQFADDEAPVSESFGTEVEARAALAEQLRESVQPGDRIEVDGGSYPSLEKAAQVAPVIPVSERMARYRGRIDPRRSSKPGCGY